MKYSWLEHTFVHIQHLISTILHIVLNVKCPLVSKPFNWSVTFKLYFSGSYRNICRQITQPRILPLFFSVMARFRSNGRNTATGFSCRIFAHERKSGEFPSTTASTTTTTTTTTPEVLTYFNCFSGQNSARNMEWTLLTF